jgi:hypothetical protein
LDPNFPSFFHACTVSLFGSLTFIIDFYRTFLKFAPLSLAETIKILPEWIFKPPTEMYSLYYALFYFSLIYFCLDIFVMGRSFKHRHTKCKRLKFAGFVVHHIICMYGISASLWSEESLRDARIILLCFTLAEISNPIRGYAALFVPSDQQKKFDLVSRKSNYFNLESLKLAYLALFFTTRMICARLAFAFIYSESSPALISTRISSHFILLFSGISAIQIFRDPDIIF